VVHQNGKFKPSQLRAHPSYSLYLPSPFFIARRKDSIVEGSVLAKKENSAFLEAYGSEDKNSFTVRKAVRRRKL